jgi:hypothetical protein
MRTDSALAVVISLEDEFAIAMPDAILARTRTYGQLVETTVALTTPRTHQGPLRLPPLASLVSPRLPLPAGFRARAPQTITATASFSDLEVPPSGHSSAGAQAIAESGRPCRIGMTPVRPLRGGSMYIAESYRQWASAVVHRLWYHRGRVAVDRKLDALARHMDGRLRHLEDKVDAMLQQVGKDHQALGLRSLSLAASPTEAVVDGEASAL